MAILTSLKAMPGELVEELVEEKPISQTKLCFLYISATDEIINIIKTTTYNEEYWGMVFMYKNVFIV